MNFKEYKKNSGHLAEIAIMCRLFIDFNQVFSINI